MLMRLAVICTVIFLWVGLAGEAYAVKPLGGLSSVNPTWTGDLDGMIQRRAIRVLVTYSKTFYFLDGGDQRGLSYELIQAFEKHINRQRKKDPLKVNLIIIPVARDELLPALVDGRGDIAIANLTITATRQKQVDFSKPFINDVQEIFVTGPNKPLLRSPTDAAGMEVHVRRSSSYYQSLLKLQKKLKAGGMTPMKLIMANENLEDEDLLEMLNAGLIPALVMDNHKARFWVQIFKTIRLHPDLPLRQAGRIGWAIRKNSPLLVREINLFARQNRAGTLTGNILFKRYLQNTRWARKALSKEDMTRFNNVVDLFRKYADRYEFDYLMLMALAYQESRLDHSKRSPAGAVGIMQVLPSTAAGNPINIPDIEKLESNIHAGVKYLRHIHDVYFANDQQLDALNKMLFSFAAYNAGPSRVRSLRRQTAQMNLDPNRWFHNVEILAAKQIGRETVHYVSNIFKYYLAYRLVVDKIHDKQQISGGGYWY